MDYYQKAWENDYRSRGPLWGGALSLIPDLPSGSRVLELGCGNGKTLSAALQYPWTLAAVDISLEAVRLSRMVVPNRADLLVADACQLPFKDQVFDALFAFHVTGHMLHADREKMADEATRVLKIGGKLFFRDFSSLDMRARRGKEIEPGTFMRGQGIITHYFAGEEAKELFNEMKPLSIQTRKWNMKIRGRDHLRAEVESIFQKV